MLYLKTLILFFFNLLRKSKSNKIEQFSASRGSCKDHVQLQWSQNKTTSKYIILKSKEFQGIYFPIVESNGISHLDYNVKAGKTYWYKILQVTGLSLTVNEEKVQGWPLPHMPSGDESTTARLLRILRTSIHIQRIKNEAKKRLPLLPEPESTGHLVPSSEKIFNDIKNLCKTPHRRIGSPESHKAEHFIKKRFSEILGKENVFTDSVSCNVYEAVEWNLKIMDDNQYKNLDSFYAVNTGCEENRSVNGLFKGEMVWAGHGRDDDFKKLNNDLSGKIVVALCPFPDFPLGILSKIFNGFYYTSDPDRSINIKTKRNLTFVRKNFPVEYNEKKNPESIYWKAFNRGALGLVLILHNHQGKVNTHWGPYDAKLRKMPCLYVDHYESDYIKSRAQKGAPCEMTLKTDVKPGTGHNIYGVLPGLSQETILVSTHHDSPFKGATEDGTGVATLMALAQSWSKMPLNKRDKTMVFVSTTGHFYGGKGARDFVEHHKNSLLKNLAICINVEHPAAKDYIDDGSGNMIDSGLQALNCIFVNEDFFSIAAAQKILKKHKPQRVILVQSNILGPVPPGEAGHYHMYTGVNFIHWIGQPYYLLTKDDTLDKVMIDQLNPIASALSDCIGIFMKKE